MYMPCTPRLHVDTGCLGCPLPKPINSRTWTPTRGWGATGWRLLREIWAVLGWKRPFHLLSCYIGNTCRTRKTKRAHTYPLSNESVYVASLWSGENSAFNCDMKCYNKPIRAQRGKVYRGFELNAQIKITMKCEENHLVICSHKFITYKLNSRL